MTNTEHYKQALRNVTRRVYEEYLGRAKRALDQATYEVTYWSRALEAMDQVELALEVNRVVEPPTPSTAERFPPLA